MRSMETYSQSLDPPQILTDTDIDEYPQTYEIQKRCVNMLSRLWHAPLEPEEGKGGRKGGNERRERGLRISRLLKSVKDF